MTNEQVAFGGADIIWAAAIIDYSLPPSPDIRAPMHQIYIFLYQTLRCTFRVLAVICTIFIREGFKKSKWKFKMAFAIRGPTPPPPP